MRGAAVVRRAEERTASCGSDAPSFSSKVRDQMPPASTTASARIVPRSVTAPRTRPASRSSERTASPLDDPRPTRPGEPCHRRHRQRRFGEGVARRVQRAAKAQVVAPEHARGLAGVEQPRAELELADALEPVRAHRELGVGLGEVGHAAGAKADVLVELGGEAGPEREALAHQRQLGELAPLAAYPAPVARGLFAGHTALLAQRDVDAAFGEKERGGHTDDAAADDEHAGGARWRGGRVDELGHGPEATAHAARAAKSSRAPRGRPLPKRARTSDDAPADIATPIRLGQLRCGRAAWSWHRGGASRRLTECVRT